MIYYIFSFSYIEKKRMKDFKNSFLFSKLSTDLDLNFLTKKNYNSLFSDRYSELKNLLSGKYFVFSFKKENKNFKDMLSTFELIKNFLINFEDEVSFFTIIYKNTYIFNDFLIKSKNYKFDNFLNLTHINNKLFISLMLKKEIINYSLNFFRINNLNFERKKIYQSYFY